MKSKIKKPIEESVEALSASLEGLMHFVSAIALIVIFIFSLMNSSLWCIAIIPFIPVPFAVTHYIFGIIKMLCKMSRNLEKIAISASTVTDECKAPGPVPVPTETSEQ